MGQRVALYCRVSTADQSCARQERDLTAFAARAGYEVIGVYKETASGVRLDRAERRKVMALAQRHELDVVLVTELALLQSAGEGARRPRSGQVACQAALSSSRSLTNWTASASAEAPRPKARSTMRASPRMSRVKLKAAACPLRSARIASKPLIVA